MAGGSRGREEAHEVAESCMSGGVLGYPIQPHRVGQAGPNDAAQHARCSFVARLGSKAPGTSPDGFTPGYRADRANRRAG